MTRQRTGRRGSRWRRVVDEDDGGGGGRVRRIWTGVTARYTSSDTADYLKGTLAAAAVRMLAPYILNSVAKTPKTYQVCNELRTGFSK